ncbi:MAG: TraB/GumN family protein [Sphingobacteriales bacterium]|nr:MAG: TraB/GumN family protein [Sphingobacteriales bacterium]
MKVIYSILLLLALQCTSAFAQKTILWKVTIPSSQKTSYLLGSFHQMGNSFVDEKHVIKDLMLASDIVIFEAIEDPRKMITAVMKARPDDFSYRQHIDSADVNFLESYAANWPVPISKLKPGEMIIKLQQTFVEQNCGTIKPSDTAKHLDNYLQAIAEMNGKKLLGLERYEDQFKAINIAKDGEFTWNKANKAVHIWVERLQKGKDKKSICRSAKEYMNMKFDYQFDVKCAENDPMLAVRNEKWMPQLVEHLSASNAFVVVGLFHLYGDCGIITQLRKKGYEITPVSIK